MTNCFVTTIDPALAKKMKEDLLSQGFKLTQPPYTLFNAQKEGVSCTLYTSGKLTVQGKGKEDFILFYIEPEILKNLSYSNPHADIDRTPRIGVDEAGKGDFFGPLCTASVYADGDLLDALIQMGVRDSKTLTDETIHKLAQKIKATCPYEILRLFPQKYNELYSRFKNLNTLLAWCHATAIDNLSKKTGCKNALIDKFAHESLVQRALKDKSVHLTQRTKGEEDPVVAAASILARDAFVTGIEDLSQTFGFKLPKGAGDPVKKAIAQFIKTHTPEQLGVICKLHFKTYTDHLI